LTKTAIASVVKIENNKWRKTKRGQNTHFAILLVWTKSAPIRIMVSNVSNKEISRFIRNFYLIIFYSALFASE
jgi:hypothetical protein